MNKKGLTSEEITKAASQMIAEVGYANFSLRDLAARLGVRPSSLYNHITGIGEINTAVAVDASLQNESSYGGGNAGSAARGSVFEGACRISSLCIGESRDL